MFPAGPIVERWAGVGRLWLGGKGSPGHTKGSIAILTDDGQLFAGDTLSNRTKPASASFIENERDLQDSLAILKQTKARVVYPGHGKPFPFEALSAIT